MSNQAQVCEVSVSGGHVKAHRADSFYVDERGHLVIQADKAVVCVYPPGQWFRAWMAGNLQTK